MSKGLYEKASRNQYPGQAAINYLSIVSESKERVMIPDGEKAPLSKNFFELYATDEAKI